MLFEFSSKRLESANVMDFGMPRQGAQACQHNLINHCLGKDVREFHRYESS